MTALLIPQRRRCVRRLPSLAANLYTDVRERSGWTDFQLAGSGLGAIMVLGVAFIIGLDQYYAANPHLLADLHQD